MWIFRLYLVNYVLYQTAIEILFSLFLLINFFTNGQTGMGFLIDGSTNNVGSVLNGLPLFSNVQLEIIILIRHGNKIGTSRNFALKLISIQYLTGLASRR